MQRCLRRCPRDAGPTRVDLRMRGAGTAAACVAEGTGAVRRFDRTTLLGMLSVALSLALAAAVVAFFTMIGAGAALAQDLKPVPALQARVTDLTRTLSAGDIARIDQRLAELERRKGAQVAVLMVESTLPEPIEQYSIRVAEAWKIGRGKAEGRAVDDGVILLVAKADRKVRIEVGYGLEGAIPDAVARRIIAEQIAPRFRTGDFAGGIEAAVGDLARLIEGEALPAPWQPGHTDGQGDDGGWLGLLLFAVVGGMIATAILGRFLGAAAGGVGAGVLASGAGAGLPLAIGAGVGLFLFLLVFGGAGFGGGRRGGRGGPVVMLPPGGWGGGFGRGGGGGFSGGGGGFGGGGASGDW